MGCRQGCKEEFHPRNFLLGHEKPELFVTSQYGPSIWYLIYRVFWFVYKLVWIILSGAWEYSAWYSSEANRIKWFLYLTNWCYLLLVINLGVQAGVAVYYYVKFKKGSGFFPDMPCYLKFTWCLYNIATNTGLIIGIAWWTLFWPAYEAAGVTTPHSVDIHTHGITLLYIAVDMFVTATPVRIYHAWFGMLYGVVYAIFTVIYYAAGGTNAQDEIYIYKGILDWSNVGTTMMYVVLVIIPGTIVVQCLMYGLYRLRLLLYRCCCDRKGAMSSENATSYNTGVTESREMIAVEMKG